MQGNSLLLKLFGIMLLGLLALSSMFAVEDNQVQNLSVADAPFDSGNGLILRWIPLPKEARVIEYRVYRGACPDTLFMVGQIPVNAKIGVAADTMYYYDKSWNPLVDIDSKTKLKKEEKQEPDSPLYREVPSDPVILKELLKHYSYLGIIPPNEYFFKSHRIEVPAEEEGDDSEIYAGLRQRQLRVYSQLKANREYYYAVLAINKERKFYPVSEIASGIPRENPPEATSKFYGVNVEDGNRLQFQWTFPLYSTDFVSSGVWMLPKTELTVFEEYREYQKLKEVYDKYMMDNPDSEIEAPVEITNPAIRISYLNNSTITGSDALIYDAVEITDGRFVDEDNDINVEVPANLEDYIFSLSFGDGYRNTSFSAPIELKVNQVNDLPVLPEFEVADKPADKGDRTTLYWGKPVVNLTNTTFLNDEASKLKINYELISNNAYTVKNIFFKAFVNGGEVGIVNEFYQDNKIVVKVPGTNLAQKGLVLDIEISFRTIPELAADYMFQQSLKFDDVSKSLKPGSLMYIDPVTKIPEEVNKYQYYPYRRRLGNDLFKQVKKVGGAVREWDDNIGYLESHYKGVSDIDLKTGFFLISPMQDMGYSAADSMSISTSIFQQDAEMAWNDIQNRIDRYQTTADTLEGEQQKSYLDEIDRLSGQIDKIKNSVLLAKAD
ncbi:MAG: hypothetical protein K8S56_10920 [Candidatus Cloacimonetes bacterium]|nr:hypothetical protein [Candidatus Cloacimonadota bacterium]